MTHMRTISALGLLVVGLFAWGQVAIAHAPLTVALRAQAALERQHAQMQVAQISRDFSAR